ncbi:hypothetical protein [Jeongeupia chitinilytica]|uniref:Uncharacterized protein n=1 Tax=Jeongeupia chitinilytica TaxID=1041641 RepID=A0ABQ3GZU2_9NEIS|nr:hypothetical protein [Jeongeupia chitinilytica]GHD60519.1 hypothetical protein GCM10007350_13680 [Jeongeupia chitinilytica]
MVRPSLLAALTLAASMLSSSAGAGLVENISMLRMALDSVCGQRLDVVWLDETRANPPCLMSYSPFCDEVQYNGPTSCMVVMHIEDEPAGGAEHRY